MVTHKKAGGLMMIANLICWLTLKRGVDEDTKPKKKTEIESQSKAGYAGHNLHLGWILETYFCLF
jgi:hypothetical protein